MDITVSNEVGVRKNFYEFPSDVGAALIHAGLAFQIAKRAPVVAPELTESRWFVQRLPQSGRVVITCNRPGGETVSFQGNPADYKKLENGLIYCDSACPESVIEEYA